MKRLIRIAPALGFACGIAWLAHMQVPKVSAAGKSTAVAIGGSGAGHPLPRTSGTPLVVRKLSATVVNAPLVVTRSCDLNADGRVDGIDLERVRAAYGAHDSMADVTGDGVVDGRDLGAILSAWSG